MSMIDEPFYIRSIYEEIRSRWPDLHDHILSKSEMGTLHEYRDNLVDTIYLPDCRLNYDNIIRYIMKHDEDMISFWIL